MLKFSANVSMMFTEEPDPLKRINLAKDAGFGAAGICSSMTWM